MDRTTRERLHNNEVRRLRRAANNVGLALGIVTVVDRTTGEAEDQYRLLHQGTLLGRADDPNQTIEVAWEEVRARRES